MEEQFTYHGFLQSTGKRATLLTPSGKEIILEEKEGYYFNDRYWYTDEAEITFQTPDDAADYFDADVVSGSVK